MPRGRPPYQPTAEKRGTVRGLVMTGATEEMIARIIGCDPKTLRKYYAEELETSIAMMCKDAAVSLYKMATKKDGGATAARAAMFILERRGGWPLDAPTPGAPGAPGPDAVQAVRIEFVGPAGGEELGSGPLQPGEEAGAEPDDDAP